MKKLHFNCQRSCRLLQYKKSQLDIDASIAKKVEEVWGGQGSSDMHQ